MIQRIPRHVMISFSYYKSGPIPEEGHTASLGTSDGCVEGVHFWGLNHENSGIDFKHILI